MKYLLRGLDDLVENYNSYINEVLNPKAQRYYVWEPDLRTYAIISVFIVMQVMLQRRTDVS